MTEYDRAIAEEAFGHVPMVRDRGRDESRIPLIFENRPDGVYFLMGHWRVMFGGSYRFEEFGLEKYDDANALLKQLKAGGDL